MLLSQLSDVLLGNISRAPFFLLGGAIVIYWAAWIVYSLFFHPLRKYPGPLLGRISKLQTSWHLFNGTIHIWHLQNHKKYGPVVRYGPDNLSFTDPQAWSDIHGFKNAPGKDAPSYRVPPNQVNSLFSERDDEKHRYQRKIFTHAFSDRALKEQEPLFNKYTDTLVERIKRTVYNDPKAKIDIVMLLNFTTFDIMADLAFGESLGLLQREDQHPWVGLLLGAFKSGARIQAIVAFEPWRTLYDWWQPQKLQEMRRQHFNFSAERVNKRLKLELDRPDIWGLVLRNQEKGNGLSLGEMHSNAGLFMGAGTETTATELSGLLFYLLRNPAIMRKVVDEVRSAFASEEDITMERIAQLSYLHACVEEGLRIYPPVPAGLPRRVGTGGITVCGEYVPEGTHVSIPQYATYRLNFAQPDGFHPERFLPNAPPQFASDKRAALQPFSYGPRNCLGKNMAYHEIRLVLTKLLWNFDWELCQGMEGWAEEQGCFGVWEKDSLWVRAKVRG